MASALQQSLLWPLVKGFMERPENPVTEEPCRCLPGLQCYPINCEYCERIPTCSAGYGLELDPGESQSPSPQQWQQRVFSEMHAYIKVNAYNSYNFRVYEWQEEMCCMQERLLLCWQQCQTMQTMDKVSQNMDTHMHKWTLIQPGALKMFWGKMSSLDSCPPLHHLPAIMSNRLLLES